MEPKKWLRCNNCFNLMCNSKDPFFLAFCGHIFCSKCVQKVSKQCPRCKDQNVATMPLIEPLNPEVKHCFESTEELFEKLKQAVSFQNMQFNLNCKCFNKVEKKYMNLKVKHLIQSKEVKNLSEEKRQLQKQNEDLKFDLESKQKLNKLINSSALMTPLSSLGSARSFGSGKNDNRLCSKPQSFKQSVLTPTVKLIRIEPNSNTELRIPNVQRGLRSGSSSTKNSFSKSSTSRNPFSHYIPLSQRR